MKRSKFTLATAALTAAFALASPIFAQTATTVGVLNSAGTISEFDSKVIAVRTSTTTTPVRYTATKTTTYVDESGAPVSVELVRSGVPVTVYYTTSGDAMIANRVVVSRPVTTTTVAPVVTAPAPAPRVIVPAAPVVVEETTTTTTTTTKDD
jgi:hypothetical protein